MPGMRGRPRPLRPVAIANLVRAGSAYSGSIPAALITWPHLRDSDR